MQGSIITTSALSIYTGTASDWPYHHARKRATMSMLRVGKRDKSLAKVANAEDGVTSLPQNRVDCPRKLGTNWFGLFKMTSPQILFSDFRKFFNSWLRIRCTSARNGLPI
jgi:hypothetical protein